MNTIFRKAAQVAAALCFGLVAGSLGIADRRRPVVHVRLYRPSGDPLISDPDSSSDPQHCRA